ncbi:hypothetical protein NFA_505 [Nocardia farcinica IFM 10152]|uniref:Uncharacterized protein n=1 Tax=Nocardia farcinica (strain IFM 10152) TaxID=247156 RepID=B2RGL6_NOCFA|nr:hypothetical protein NFA_505 [Nocardia farcinica IFM 10152]
MLHLLDEHEDLVEAALRRYCGVRYTDRWRVDEQGQQRLTLREIWVYLQEALPGDSAIVRHFNNGRARWGDQEYLLADVAGILAGKPHPARPKPQSLPVNPQEKDRVDEIRAKRIAEKRAREAAAREQHEQEQGGEGS